MSLFARIKSLDVYRKLPSDLTEPTVSGAIVSLGSTLIMLLLFFTELRFFLKVQTVSDAYIDIERGSELLTVDMDIMFPKMVCDFISLDVQDTIGTHTVDVGGKLLKKRYTKDGKLIGEMKGQPFNQERAKQALHDQEGCQLVGSFEVTKVPGNFHIACHGYHHYLQQFLGSRQMETIDLSHVINHLSFGDSSEINDIKKKFGNAGVLSPLNGVKKIKKEAASKTFVDHTYFLNIIQTTYEDLSGNEYYSHQFTASSNEHQTPNAPSVYFRFDLSPLTVSFKQTKEGFGRFLVQICAIIGGIFTIAGIIDSVVHKSITNILKKSSAGKLT